METFRTTDYLALKWFLLTLLLQGACMSQSMNLRKSVETFFVLMYVITSECNLFFLSLMLEANLCLAFDADRPAPSVQ